MPAAQKTCDTHSDLFNFVHELPRFAESLKKQRKIKVVAIGSSSTAGESDVVPYPERLAMLLREHYRDHMIDVLNHGIGGQEATTELLRFEPDVLAEAPALVIWQVGTNAVFRKDEFDFGEVIAAIKMGLNRLLERSIDVVVMDSQYVPAVVNGEKLKLSEELVGKIGQAANAVRVNVFRRFELMRHWVTQDGLSIGELVREGDEKMLHMSDWATNCVSRALFESIRGRVEA
ncbi:SGNH/GDSL hydrolase family protein [Bradyrhizobium sp. WSM 1738]|uniref:SGNH/GDSL hydrolase family protein n=1 Tax=Bradyrhizobium hereditatis TaxID=2821405 RepID=UPI001CE23607|nr:SGNH/GDSL hydrolase family protein [Bradyrhizobium hereditatis]MCA6113533.1 SGNH/GDSL hydrolase family protein [Bradyrhizobium hereditatis]